MNKIVRINDITLKQDNLPLVIGYFGAIHLAHSLLLKKHQNFNLLTFENHIKKQDNQLYDFKHRIDNLKLFNPKTIYLFDLQSNQNLTPLAFIQQVLIPLNPNYIIVGEDFRFGAQATGDVNLLKQHFNVQTIKYDQNQNTTKIKQLLLEGKVDQANKFLYMPFYLIGKWIKGKRIGRTINFPTINFTYPTDIIKLPEGSYISNCYLAKHKYQAITFVGKSKTIENEINTLVETHLIDCHIKPRMFYCSNVRNNVKVEFLATLRNNTKFSNLDELKSAINQDYAKAKIFFSKTSTN